MLLLSLKDCYCLEVLKYCDFIVAKWFPFLKDLRAVCSIYQWCFFKCRMFSCFDGVGWNVRRVPTGN